MRLTRRQALTVALGLAGAGCASVQRPPGGPVDLDPPTIASLSIDTNAVNVNAKKLEITFNEVVAERPAGVSGAGSGPVTLGAIVLLSPQVGATKVEWHRRTISIEPRNGFRPNTSYRITILPGLADLQNNVQRGTTTLIFSTGPAIAPYSIPGRVFDWVAETPARNAVVEAVANAGTADSLIYQAVTDSLGQFDVGPLGAGRYLVRTYIDADRNRERGVLEKWDTTTVEISNTRSSIELLAAQRDTAPIGIQRVDVLDSLWVRVQLDKPFDPQAQLQPSMISIKRADSSEVTVVGVMTESQANFLRPRADSTPGVGARPDPAPASPPGRSVAAPPAARPRLPRPENVIVVRIGPASPLRPGERYAITLRALRNLLGQTGTGEAVFEVPRPARPPQ